MEWFDWIGLAVAAASIIIAGIFMGRSASRHKITVCFFICTLGCFSGALLNDQLLARVQLRKAREDRWMTVHEIRAVGPIMLWFDCDIVTGDSSAIPPQTKRHEMWRSEFADPLKVAFNTLALGFVGCCIAYLIHFAFRRKTAATHDVLIS